MMCVFHGTLYTTPKLLHRDVSPSKKGPLGLTHSTIAHVANNYTLVRTTNYVCTKVPILVCISLSCCFLHINLSGLNHTQ